MEKLVLKYDKNIVAFEYSSKAEFEIYLLEKAKKEYEKLYKEYEKFYNLNPTWVSNEKFSIFNEKEAFEVKYSIPIDIVMNNLYKLYTLDEWFSKNKFVF